jgi:hypothetical protein
LNLDGKATIGQRIDNIMILRGPGMRDMWSSLLDGRMAGPASTRPMSTPGKVRTAQAIAIALSAPASDPAKRGCVVMFETLRGRT